MAAGYACGWELPRLGGATDANGRSGGDEGNDGVRVSWGLEAFSRVEDVARGEETNDVERESNGEW